MKPYACILLSDHNYFPGMMAFINSFLANNVNEYADIILIHNGLDLTDFRDERLNLVEVVQPGAADGGHTFASGLQIQARNQTFLDYADRYEAMAIFDADMFLVSCIKTLFGVAAAGFPILCNNDDHTYFTPEKVYDYKFVCNVPFFAGAKEGSIVNGEYVKLAVTEPLGDLEILNTSLVKHPEVLDKCIIYPSCLFTGVHHTHLKPQTAFMFGLYQDTIPTHETIVPNHFILTRDFMRVISVHGQWWSRPWVDGLITPMETFYQYEFGLQEAMKTKWMDYNKFVIKSIQHIFLDLIFNGKIPLTERNERQIKEDHLAYLQERHKEIG